MVIPFGGYQDDQVLVLKDLNYDFMLLRES
jgi:hypothetical protein